MVGEKKIVLSILLKTGIPYGGTLMQIMTHVIQGAITAFISVKECDGLQKSEVITLYNLLRTFRPALSLLLNPSSVCNYR